MVRGALERFKTSIRVACEAFGISQSGYHYQAKHADENDIIADWLIRLTTAQRNWGFGLCFLYLRNIKGFKWNHMGVARRDHCCMRPLRACSRVTVPKQRLPNGPTRCDNVWGTRKPLSR